MENWQSVFSSPYWMLFLLVLIFEFSLWLRQRTGNSLVNPTLITTVFIISYLFFTNTPYQTFENASKFITFWLQPAVVCLAVPLYIQWQKIKSQWLAIIISQLVGSIVGIVSGVWLVQWLGGSQSAVLSVVAKSVTTPIAIEVTKSVGGVVGINASTVLVAGVVGQMVGLAFFVWTKVKSPISQSIAMGSASHAIGIAGIMPLGQRYVAYGTVGLIMNGILTAFFAPIIVPFLV